MIEISKELLSKVLGIEVILIRDGLCDSNLIFETPDETLSRKFSPYVPRINIYELAHKCKEWAYDKGYTVDVYNKSDGLYIEVSKSILATYLYKSLLFDLVDEQNELFKACEWILKEIK